MNIRRFCLGEEAALFEIYHSAIHLVACRDYTVEQVNAWAPPDLDQMLWAKKISGINPFVVERDDVIVGYADVQPSGYIDHFFVSGHYPRRGIGRALMTRLHQEAERLELTELTADVSRTAQPFFEKYGFSIIEQRKPELRGVVIPNALMHKVLP
ncbi:MAG: GNAT family N-acetyltransferase [Sneathiella sp.]